MNRDLPGAEGGIPPDASEATAAPAAVASPTESAAPEIVHISDDPPPGGDVAAPSPAEYCGGVDKAASVAGVDPNSSGATKFQAHKPATPIANATLNPLQGQDYLHAMQKQQVGALQRMMQQQQQQQQTAFMMHLQQQQQQLQQLQQQQTMYPFLPIQGHPQQHLLQMQQLQQQQQQLQQQMRPAMAGSYLPVGGARAGLQALHNPANFQQTLQQQQQQQQMMMNQKQQLAQKQQAQFLAQQKQQALAASQSSVSAAPVATPSQDTQNQQPTQQQLAQKQLMAVFDATMAQQRQAQKAQPVSGVAQAAQDHVEDMQKQQQHLLAINSFAPGKLSAFGASAFVKKNSGAPQAAGGPKVATTSVYELLKQSTEKAQSQEAAAKAALELEKAGNAEKLSQLKKELIQSGEFDSAAVEKLEKWMDNQNLRIKAGPKWVPIDITHWRAARNRLNDEEAAKEREKTKAAQIEALVVAQRQKYPYPDDQLTCIDKASPYFLKPITSIQSPPCRSLKMFGSVEFVGLGLSLCSFVETAREVLGISPFSVGSWMVALKSDTPNHLIDTTCLALVAVIITNSPLESHLQYLEYRSWPEIARRILGHAIYVLEEESAMHGDKDSCTDAAAEERDLLAAFSKCDFWDLPLAQRVTLIQFLLCECIDSPLVSEHIDNVIQRHEELRKERNDIVREQTARFHDAVREVEMDRANARLQKGAPQGQSSLTSSGGVTLPPSSLSQAQEHDYMIRLNRLQSMHQQHLAESTKQIDLEIDCDPVRQPLCGRDRFDRRYWILNGTIPVVLVQTGDNTRAPENGELAIIETVEELTAVSEWLDARGAKECELKKSLVSILPRFQEFYRETSLQPSAEKVSFFSESVWISSVDKGALRKLRSKMNPLCYLSSGVDVAQSNKSGRRPEIPYIPVSETSTLIMFAHVCAKIRDNYEHLRSVAVEIPEFDIPDLPDVDDLQDEVKCEQGSWDLVQVRESLVTMEVLFFGAFVDLKNGLADGNSEQPAPSADTVDELRNAFQKADYSFTDPSRSNWIHKVVTASVSSSINFAILTWGVYATSVLSALIDQAAVSEKRRKNQERALVQRSKVKGGRITPVGSTPTLTPREPLKTPRSSRAGSTPKAAHNTRHSFSDDSDGSGYQLGSDLEIPQPMFNSISEIRSALPWNTPGSRRQLRLLMIRDGAQAGDVIEVLAPASARKKGERWFMEVVDGAIIDKSTEEPKISSCRWWINWLPGQFTGPDKSMETLQPQEVRCIIDWGSAKDMMKKERQGYVPKRGDGVAAGPSSASQSSIPLAKSRKIVDSSSSDDELEYSAASDIYAALPYGSDDYLLQLRLLMIHSGAQPGDIVEVRPSAAARKKGERWFMEVVDGKIRDKTSEAPTVTSCRWWINWLPGQFTGPDAGGSRLDSQEVRCIIDWGSAKDMMKKERQGYVPKRGDTVVVDSKADTPRVPKRAASDMTAPSRSTAVAKKKMVAVASESESEESGDEEDDGSVGSYEDSKYDAVADIHEAYPWNSPGSRRQLRLLMIRDGAQAGDVIEVLAPASARKKGERWFMEVVDGAIIGKSTEEPKISSCRWWINWLPGQFTGPDKSMETLQPQEVRCIIDWGSAKDMMKKERQGYVPKRSEVAEHEIDVVRSSSRRKSVDSSAQNISVSKRLSSETSTSRIKKAQLEASTSGSDSDSSEAPKFETISEVYTNCKWNSSSSRHQLRLLMIRDGAQAGDVIEVLAPASARKKGERWFMEVVDGAIIDKSTEEPKISSCRWWINWLPGQFTGPDKAAEGLQPQEVRCIIDWGSAKDMMKKERQGYVPKRDDTVVVDSKADTPRVPKRAASDMTAPSRSTAVAKKKMVAVASESESEESGDEEDDGSVGSYEDSKYDTVADIHEAYPWNSPGSRRQLRLLMIRDGAHAGDVIEVLAPASARKKGERWFMEVVDGAIIDKSTEEPKISSCRWWINWLPGQFTGPDKAAEGLQPQEVRCIIDWGSAKDMMKKERQGYVPKRGDGAPSFSRGESDAKRAKQGDSPLKLRERIVKQGSVEAGLIVEVLPPSDAQSKGERWFMQVVDGTIKTTGANGSRIASCKWFKVHIPGGRSGLKLDTAIPAAVPCEVRTILAIGPMSSFKL